MTGRVELDRSGRDGLLTLAAVGLGLIAARVILLRESGPLPAFVGIVLVMLSLGLAVRAYLARIRDAAAGFQAFRIMADDPAACFMTDAEGHVILRNSAAELRFGSDARSLLDALGRHVLHPAELLGPGDRFSIDP